MESRLLAVDEEDVAAIFSTTENKFLVDEEDESDEDDDADEQLLVSGPTRPESANPTEKNGTLL